MAGACWEEYSRSLHVRPALVTPGPGCWLLLEKEYEGIYCVSQGPSRNPGSTTIPRVHHIG